MERTAVSVICYVIAGFFAFSTSLIAFMPEIPVAGKLAMGGGCFGLPALVCLAIGLAISGFQKWQRDAGIVLLATSAMTALTAVTMVCAYFTPELKSKSHVLAIITAKDVATGLACLGVLAGVGVLLLLNSRSGHLLPAPPLPEVNEALAALNHQLETHPDDADAWFRRGALLQGLARHAEALADLREAARIRPNHAPTWRLMSEVLSAVGAHEKARNAWAHALELDAKIGQ